TAQTTFAQTEIASPAADAMLIPDTPAGQALAWVLSVVNGETPVPDNAGIEERFAPSFLAVVPAASLAQTLQQLHDAFAPVAITEINEPQTPLMLNATAMISDGTKVIVVIAVEADEPHLIEGLQFAPHEESIPEVPVIADWSEFEAILATDAGTYGVSASQLVADSLEPVHQAAADDAFAIGSLFKLYVLAAVATEIEAGAMAWDTEIEVVEEFLSSPSGVTQAEPLGTMIDVESLATRMISISDNTATDLLLHAVGREKVEATLETLGNSVPERNLPFLTTRELFVLKLGDEARREAFIAADEAGKRAILAEMASEPLADPTTVTPWEKPIAIDTIEWFASMNDLERAHLWMRDAWQRPGLEPLKGVLTANPGVPYDAEIWPLVAFKGGSEPGVMAMAWLLERNDGEVFTFAAAVNDPEAPVDEMGIALAAAGAFALLAG
ncbi:MAG: serine hydrolase, partial [Thermomicrobiales bacterium]|nr:serine hydrolase [Thermomicrobiales bacterium]